MGGISNAELQPLSDQELRDWRWFEEEDRRAVEQLGWRYTKVVIPMIGMTAAPVPARPKKMRIRHSDPKPGPLRPLPLGTRKGFSAAKLKELTDWTWAEKKTKDLFAEYAKLHDEPAGVASPHPEKRKKQKNTHRRYTEDQAYRVMIWDQEREKERLRQAAE
jgi:hypothetical protein